jgi:hypothetical protein
LVSSKCQLGLGAAAAGAAVVGFDAGGAAVDVVAAGCFGLGLGFDAASSSLSVSMSSHLL